MTEKYEPNQYTSWVFLLKELYEKNCKKYEAKKYSSEYNPKDWYQT